MLINFAQFYESEQSLTPERSRALLEFCRSCGATVFTVNFLCVKGEESETLMDAFFDRLSPFSAEQKVLECIQSSGFKLQPCWALNDASIELLLQETSGDLFAYNILCLPEDWVFYRDDSILLQIVSHEHEATLRISVKEHEVFQTLGIPHRLGLPEWTGLSEGPSKAKC